MVVVVFVVVVSNWSSVQGVMWYYCDGYCYICDCYYYYHNYSDDMVVEMDGIPTIVRECDVRIIQKLRKMMVMIVEVGPLVPF